VPFIERLKSTGESYDQFLRRLRKIEDKAGKCLPENKKFYKIWEKEMQETDLFNELENWESWGWRNSWTPEKEEEVKKLNEQGYKFSYYRTSRGYSIGLNRELSVYFRIDTSG
jgi:hypothetical protein